MEHLMNFEENEFESIQGENEWIRAIALQLLFPKLVLR